jgi:phosphatidate cytidylyltransferase
VAADIPSQPPSAAKTNHELALRVVSAAVLAPVTVAIAYLGGWPFLVFWTLAGIGVFLEWSRIVGGARPLQILGGTALAAAAVLLGFGHAVAALGLIAASAVAATAIAAPSPRGWAGAGVIYAAAVLVGPVLLRADAGHGFTAIILLFAIVWATDILGYFVGRLIGGPKLWPRVSPKKTWSGALGGVAGAVIAAVAVAQSTGLNLPTLVALAVLVSAVSQGGDLLESSVKRHFGVKDAGRAIPGHGGFMDRLDGFLAAALVAAIIGLARGGIAEPARGLLVW